MYDVLTCLSEHLEEFSVEPAGKKETSFFTLLQPQKTRCDTCGEELAVSGTD